MSTDIRVLRSSAPSLRPKATDLEVGQPMVNFESSDPGLYFRLDNGALMKIGPCHIGPNAPNSTPGQGGETGNSVGEMWVDTSGQTDLLKVYTSGGWVTLSTQGLTGEKGDKGDPFAYSDFTPTELEALKGEKGDKFVYNDFTTEELETLKGEKGNTGDKGEKFVHSDFTAGELEELKGEKGEKGLDGNATAGEKGEKGEPGDADVSNGAISVTVHNGEVGTLFKGRAVYVSGTYTSGISIVKLADSDGADTYPAIGLVSEDIPIDENGEVVISGVFEGFDTDSAGWDAGSALYLASTEGDLTSTRPSSALEKVQKVGIVTRRDATDGSILVMGAGRTNDVPNELTELTGVDLNAVDLGTFVGTTIADNSDIKTALQAVETEVETKLASVDLTSDVSGSLPVANGGTGATTKASAKAALDIDHLNNLTGIAATVNNLGTFTGSTITDDQTIKAALQDLETEVEAKVDLNGTNLPGPFNNDSEAESSGVEVGEIYKTNGGTISWRVS